MNGLRSIGRPPAPWSSPGGAAPGLAWTVAGVVVLAVVYFAGARIGIGFALVGGNASPIWPPTGIAVAALFLLTPRLWPGVLAGAIAASIVNGVPVAGSAVIGVAAVAEALAATWLLRRGRFRPQEDRLADVPILVLSGGALPAVIGATIGLAGLALVGSIAAADLWTAWLAWWAGDALSVLIVGALLFTWASRPALATTRRRSVEAALALSTVVAVSVVLFFDVFDLRASGQSVAFPLIPVVIWVAFRVGPRGNALAAVLYSVVAITATERDLGPFVGTTREGSLFYLAAFMGLVAATGAAVAAVVAEREVGREALLEAGIRANEALQRLQSVEAIGRLLAEQGPTPEALGSVVGALSDVFGYSHPSIYTGDESLVRLGAQRGYADPIMSLDASSGVIARVMRSRETQFLADVTADPEFICADPAIRSEIAAPLMSHGVLLGVLNVENRQSLGERDLAAVSVVADRVAAALALAAERATLTEQAVRDSLTGLHNRRYFDEAMAHLSASRARGVPGSDTPLAAVMFDLDHFGDINKAHGLQVGDEVLRAFGRIVRERFRSSDIVARYGGEEFVAVLVDAQGADAVRVADWVRTEFAATTVVGTDGRPLSVTVSAGCAASYPGQAPSALVGAADVGLRMAKRAGRDVVVLA